jgi:hypothetical protein
MQVGGRLCPKDALGTMSAARRPSAARSFVTERFMVISFCCVLHVAAGWSTRPPCVDAAGLFDHRVAR